MDKPLKGKVAVVAGAMRGAGRGIAVMMGAAGATVYCTGRSVRGNPSDMHRPETIEDTAKMVTAAGGEGIPVRVDHRDEAQVRELFARIEKEQGGRLDVLVNDVWGGERLTKWETPFWEHSLADGLQIQERAVRTHMIAAWYAARLMVPRQSGLIVEITDGVDYRYRAISTTAWRKFRPSIWRRRWRKTCARTAWQPWPSAPASCGPKTCWTISASRKRTGRTRPNAASPMPNISPPFRRRRISSAEASSRWRRIPMYSRKPARSSEAGTCRTNTASPMRTAEGPTGATTRKNTGFGTKQGRKSKGAVPKVKELDRGTAPFRVRQTKRNPLLVKWK